MSDLMINQKVCMCVYVYVYVCKLIYDNKIPNVSHKQKLCCLPINISN